LVAALTATLLGTALADDAQQTELHAAGCTSPVHLPAFVTGAANALGAQIARALGLSLKTVQNYVSRVLDKLQVADRTQAAIRAREGLSRVRGLPT